MREITLKCRFNRQGIPLKSSPWKTRSVLNRGSVFSLKVLFNGAPLADAEVHATYAGFSDQPFTFALTVKTDREGMAGIRLLEKGEWFVSVTHETPYPDNKECDTEKYNATITFDVK